MSLTKTIAGSAHIAALLAAITLAPVSTVHAQGLRRECSDYAREAIGQNRENERMRCGLDGDRWTDARERHFAWCLISPRRAAEERRIRRRQLMECAIRHRDGRLDAGGRAERSDTASRGRVADCDTYAKIAAIQAEANEKYGCGYHGAEWSRNERSHFQMCMTSTRDAMTDEMRYRVQGLHKCFSRLGE